MSLSALQASAYLNHLTGLRVRAEEHALEWVAADTVLFEEGSSTVKDPDDNEICFGLAKDAGVPQRVHLVRISSRRRRQALWNRKRFERG